MQVVKTGAVDRATMIADGCTHYWTFLNSYYFVGTVVTTIGYGNVAPATNSGKVKLSIEDKYKNLIHGGDIAGPLSPNKTYAISRF